MVVIQKSKKKEIKKPRVVKVIEDILNCKKKIKCKEYPFGCGQCKL